MFPMQQHTFPQSRVQKPVVIEVGGEPQGVVVPHDDGYRFLAVKFPVFGIDGQTFASVEDARLAAANVIGTFEADREIIE
jgi:hypothetical protein